MARLINLRDDDGELIGKLNPETGRAQIGDAFYTEERACHVTVDERRVSRTQVAAVKSCSGCGYEFGAETRSERIFHGRVINEVELPSFCPNCGAQVIA